MNKNIFLKIPIAVICLISIYATHIQAAAIQVAKPQAAAEDKIILKTRDNKEFKILKRLTSKFGLITTALDADKNAPEVPLPGITAPEFKLIYNALIIDEPRFKNTDEIVDFITQHITPENINTIYKLADYLAINPDDNLFKIVNQKYAEFLRDFLKLSIEERKKAKINVLEQAKNMQNAKYYLPHIAKQYYLLTGEDLEDLDMTIPVIKTTVKELLDAKLLNPEILKEWPNLEKDPNSRNAYGRTVFWNVALENDHKSIRALIKLGTEPEWNLNYSDPKSLTSAQILVKYNVPVNKFVHTHSGVTVPLTLAVRNRNIPLVKYLLSKGASITAKYTGEDAEESPIEEVKRLQDLKNKSIQQARSYGREDTQALQDLEELNQIEALLKKYATNK